MALDMPWHGQHPWHGCLLFKQVADMPPRRTLRALHSESRGRIAVGYVSAKVPRPPPEQARQPPSPSSPSWFACSKDAHMACARARKYTTRPRARPSAAPHSQPPGALRTARTARAPRPLWIFVRSRPSRRLPASGRGAGRGQNIRRPAAAAAAAAGLLPLLDDRRDADPHVHARPQVRPAERERSAGPRTPTSARARTYVRTHAS